MSQYTAVVSWARNGAVFTDNRYSRVHRWAFDGGLEVPASASPQVVALPMSMDAAIDPEEAFVAALASCHMLWFLSLAARKGFVVESYRDQATGVLAKNTEGRMAMTEATLRPRVTFSGDTRPTAAEHDALHHEAHELCYIANSIMTSVRCEAVDVTA
jgi:organic hydroperoxide reductase OsmC/OhrA